MARKVIEATTDPLDAMLARLQLSCIRDQLDSLLDEAARANLSARETLILLCEREIARKDHRRIEMALKLAHFPAVKELAGFDFEAQPSIDPKQIRDLAASRWIANGENMLLLGRVDVVPGYIDAEVPELEAHAGGPGSLSILLGADYGYDAYGSGLFTSEKMIADKPDVVQRFVGAYLKAFQFVVDNPKEAVDIVVKANPEYKGKEETLLMQLDADIKSTFFSPYTKQHGIGAISDKQWNATAQVLKEQGMLPADFNPAGGFNSTFVEKAGALKR